MKEMIYQKMKNLEVLANGNYKGFNWWVVSYGTHPCCYIGLPKGHKFYAMSYGEIPVDCHGGLTFAGYKDDLSLDDWLIGWDYAHYLDYTPYFGEGKKWKTEELINQIKCVIDINKLNGGKR